QELQKVILVGGSCRMPAVIQYLEFLLKRDVELVHEPDQAIAIGCGTAGGIKERCSDIRDVFLSDICPFTLGLAVYDDGARDYVMEPIIERNTALPCSVNRMFSYRSTSGELQTSILQEEHRKAAANLVVRTVRIKVPKTSEEYQPISVRFTYDINGLLEVETNTFHEESASRVVIQNRMNRMSEEEVHQRLRELQAYKLPSQEKEVYRHLLERGERMYSESIGEKRMRIAALLEEFETALQQEQPQHIREVFRRVKSALDEWEADAVSFFS
ncbi:Hsp70 family protein, partial [[Clostridium] innocuum]|nr:Hsp70 family protein [[Clostridium] innocuum]